MNQGKLSPCWNKCNALLQILQLGLGSGGRLPSSQLTSSRPIPGFPNIFGHFRYLVHDFDPCDWLFRSQFKYQHLEKALWSENFTFISLHVKHLSICPMIKSLEALRSVELG